MGFNILMGLNTKPSVSDYWSRNPIYHYPLVCDRISRDRYRQISRYLHFADNSTLSPPSTPGYDRLGKVRPLIQHIQERCKLVYNPGRELAVDEAMIKFQGRSSLKQYMPKKPTRRGIKVWVLADSSNGYFSRFEVYTGKKGKKSGKGARSESCKRPHLRFCPQMVHGILRQLFYIQDPLMWSGGERSIWMWYRQVGQTVLSSPIKESWNKGEVSK